MAITFKIRVGYLFTKFLADTFIFLGLFKTARTVSASFFYSLLHSSDDILILVQSNSWLHVTPLFSLVVILYHTFSKMYVTKSQK